MNRRIKIGLRVFGNAAYSFDLDKISKWKSKVFAIISTDKHEYVPNLEKSNWAYQDTQLKNFIHPQEGADFTLAVVNFPLENNFYSRRIDNILVITLFEVADILEKREISIENFILRMIYEYVLIFKKLDRIPLNTEKITHDATKGCLFDMNIYKPDITYSTSKAQLCPECRENLKLAQVPTTFIDEVGKEIRKIRKGLYYKITDFIKKHPIISILISIAVGIGINIASSIIYDIWLRSLLGLSA